MVPQMVPILDLIFITVIPLYKPSFKPGTTVCEAVMCSYRKLSARNSSRHFKEPCQSLSAHGLLGWEFPPKNVTTGGASTQMQLNHFTLARDA
eukprot:739649-Pelagomonas_calceolata.AAC.2